MNISFLNTVILLGSVQGFIISTMLFFSKKNKQSNRLLAVLILLIALASFDIYASYSDWFDSSTLQFLTNFIPLIIVMPTGPLIYFYIQSSLNDDFRFTRKKAFHFYTVIIDIIPQLIAIVYMIGLSAGVFKSNSARWGNFIDMYNVYADVPRWLSLSFYVLASAKYLRSIKQNSSAGFEKKFKWLQQFINVFILFQVWWLIFLIPYIIPSVTYKLLDAVDWYPIYIPLAVIIYWLGIKGYIISQAEYNFFKKTSVLKVGLSNEIINQTIARLQKSMIAEKLFLNKELNLAVLSEQTGIPQKTISAVLNQHLHTSFNEFINTYRIQAFKEKVSHPETDNLTIAGIALECGFSSQATFQRTFKQVTGLSPSEFRRTILQTQ